MPSSQTEDLIRRIRTGNLPTQINAKQQKVAAMGGTPKKGGPSILSRVFDIIQRPMYGVQETLARSSEHMGSDNPRKGKNAAGDILGGLVGGLAGKHKTHGSDLLQRASEADKDSFLSKTIRENRFGIKSVAGFVLDIGLDPTTYLTGGMSKVSKADTILAKSAKVAEKVADGRKAGGEIAAGAKVARDAARKQAALDAPKVLKAEGKKVTQANIDDYIKKTVRDADKTAKAGIVDDIADTTITKNFDPKRRLNLKFAGKQFASIPMDKALKPLDAAVQSKAGQAVGKKFSTKMKFSEKTRDILRKYQSSGVAQFERTAKEVRKLFDGLSDDQLSTISHALEGDADSIARLGEDAAEKLGHQGSVNIGKDVVDLGGDYTTLQHYHDAAKRYFDQIHDSEAFRGIVRGENRADNYVYHHYDVKDKAAITKFKNKRKASLKNGRLEKTLKDAIDEGLNPVTNVDELMIRRSGKTYARASQADMTHAIINEYKITTKDKDIIEAFKRDGIPLKEVQGGFNSFRHGEGALNQLRHMGDLKPGEKIFLPEHIYDSMKNIDEFHLNAHKAEQFFKMVDKVQQPWKFWATAANPGHHVRNAMGDMYLNFLDGVTDPRLYNNAARLIWGSNPAGFSMKIGGRMFNGEEILKLYENAGAKSGFFRAEYGRSILEGKGLKGKVKGAKGKIVDMAEKREDTGRLAHFIHALKDEATKAGIKDLHPATTQLDELADKAASRVRKWNIDYGDLTEFETNYMKRIIPFYTWMRKNIPLQMEAVAMRPGRVAVVPKVNNAIEAALGTESNFENAVIPKWMKEMAPISLVGEGEGKNAIYWVPNLPIQDIGRFAEGGREGILREIMSTTSPLLRIPFEQAYGESLFSGAPIKNQGQYAAQQVPWANEIYNMIKSSQSPGETSAFGRRLKADQLFNFLTGLGVQQVGERERASELRRQEDIAQFQMKDIRSKIRRKALGG